MPNILFISYSRKQQDKAIQLDTIKLNQFYWWMDYRIVGTVDWWKNICENIEESYCIIALLSKTYMESIYCKTELAYALKLKKPILCLMLEPNVPYLRKLAEKNIQYINVFEWDINKVVQITLEAMHRVERDYNERVYPRDLSQRPQLRPPVPIPPTQTPSVEDQEIVAKLQNAQAAPAPRIRIVEAITRATYALDVEDFEQVIELLESVRPYAKDNNQEIIQELLREARLGQEYTTITSLVKSNRMRERGCQQYRNFQITYPNYPDAKELENICRIRLPSIEVMPEPFDWINILTGKVIYYYDDNAKEKADVSKIIASDVPPFTMAKYPVTNGQFAKFVDAGGYADRRWWTNEGWKQCKEDSWKQPLFWTESEWNSVNQPVVGVSWYEAVAFCRWLSDVSGENIALPTEQQWQRAAQGSDGRIYPWGNDWDCERCNNSVKPCQNFLTTSVTHYEGRNKGNSAFGIVDMAGNIWEWCLTDYENGTQDIDSQATFRVLRGGGWINSKTDEFHCDFRTWDYPSSRSNREGFRIIRS